ncbi:hypothetical protein ACFFK7_10945 [Pseudoalteromonas xiamenensis]|uniref:hypothetical protein n=1 Tax=Pseudoalteromonas xiamenensis TaxID=882626 RepID=UPI0035ECFF51
MNRYIAFFALYFLSQQAALGAEHISDHETYCAQTTSISCIDFINKRLSEKEYLSHDWLKIKSYQLDYLYDFQKFEQLVVEIEPLLAEQSKLPPIFCAQLNFYYAKSLQVVGPEAKAELYANQTVVLLEGLYEAFGDPLRVIELANMQVVFGHTKRAYQILLMAQNRFAKSKDPNFLYELNEQFANVFFGWNNLEKAVEHRITALEYARIIGHRGKMHIALGNLARTLQLNNQFNEACRYFLETLDYVEEPELASFRVMYLLRLSQSLYELHDVQSSRYYFHQIDAALVKDNYKEEYQKLENGLTHHLANG